jgi:hypothetical protein
MGCCKSVQGFVEDIIDFIDRELDEESREDFYRLKKVTDNKKARQHKKTKTPYSGVFVFKRLGSLHVAFIKESQFYCLLGFFANLPSIGL